MRARVYQGNLVWRSLPLETRGSAVSHPDSIAENRATGPRTVRDRVTAIGVICEACEERKSTSRHSSDLPELTGDTGGRSACQNLLPAPLIGVDARLLKKKEEKMTARCVTLLQLLITTKSAERVG
ncbi:hypothetical protein SKAU_G00065650 [Synaphobranchus kaupii]|uniref:Uncharacterized protein n=1 Tax=Synaphobranchus kaupii TaxID=118154 RepID=A0A9Q1G5Z7_SYNKA|nr:hypothetical protein SKAU_G00065650 [Synaphobranchus kaupii]